MRVRLLAAMASLLLLGVPLLGCDDTHTGQKSEDQSAPRLVRIMVQDEEWPGGRGLAVDLLNATPGASCADTTPCTPPQECGTLFGFPIDEAETTCHDPNSVLEVAPPVGTPLYVAGSQIRLVFSKLLDPSLESMDEDAGVYRLPPGIVALYQGDTEIEVERYYDVGGAPSASSDPVAVPFGPALVMKPLAPLAVATTYTIRIDPGRILDREGQVAVAGDGSQLADRFDFTTEGLFVMQAWNCPSYYCTLFAWFCPSQFCLDAVMSGMAGTNYPDLTDLSIPAQVAPNEGFQIQFNADVDETTVGEILLVGPDGPVPIRVGWDMGSDPTMCEMMFNPRVLNIVPVTEEGGSERADLAEGTYVLTIAGVKDFDTGLTSVAGLDVAIEVVGESVDPSEDPFASVNLLFFEECELEEPEEDGGEDTEEDADAGEGSI